MDTIVDVDPYYMAASCRLLGSCNAPISVAPSAHLGDGSRNGNVHIPTGSSPTVNDPSQASSAADVGASSTGTEVPPRRSIRWSATDDNDEEVVGDDDGDRDGVDGDVTACDECGEGDESYVAASPAASPEVVLGNVLS